MSVQAYQSFIDQFCQHGGIEHPKSMYDTAEFAIAGTKFMMRHGGAQAPHMAMVFCGFGPVNTARREEALQKLLEMNFAMFGMPGMPSLSYNPDSKEVLMMCAIFLPQASGLRAYEMCCTFATVAAGWREHYFLDADADGDEKRSPGATAARKGMPYNLSQSLAGAGQH
jgi:hypothetical protein